MASQSSKRVRRVKASDVMICDGKVVHVRMSRQGTMITTALPPAQQPSLAEWVAHQEKMAKAKWTFTMAICQSPNGRREVTFYSKDGRQQITKKFDRAGAHDFARSLTEMPSR